MLQSIGKPEVLDPYSIKNLPPLIIGGAVFNYQYSSDPHSLPVQELIERAFQLGLNALDTSPYYGPSEEIIGQALQKISFSRDQYYICTKAGRVKLDEFDYSRASVRLSVERSLQRLGTSYIDLVYMHDIEFVEPDQIMDALKELHLLKSEGLIKNFGISGYPVKFLYEIALRCKNEIAPLDAVLSYCNGCIQNTLLFEYHDKFLQDCGVQTVLNGSILSMSMLRSDITHSFHPASPALKQRVADIAEKLKEENVELADLATRFAIKEWLFKYKSGIVLGVSNLHELESAVQCYWDVKSGVFNDGKLVEQVQTSLAEHFNETWPSGNH